MECFPVLITLDRFSLAASWIGVVPLMTCSRNKACSRCSLWTRHASSLQHFKQSDCVHPIYRYKEKWDIEETTWNHSESSICKLYTNIAVTYCLCGNTKFLIHSLPFLLFFPQLAHLTGTTFAVLSSSLLVGTAMPVSGVAMVKIKADGVVLLWCVHQKAKRPMPGRRL
jgi:hypothetical protein